MIARGFKPVAWVAAIGTAALGCYMLSLQVAAERAELAALERSIVGARQDIRMLQTELGTRGRLQQLEQWNAEVLALSAPVTGQFLESNLSLARFDRASPAQAVESEVRMAAAPVAAAPAVPAASVRLASAEVAPRAQAPAPALIRAAAPDAPPVVRRASLEAAPAAAPVPRAPTAVQARSLLDESTLDELRAASRSERAPGTRN